MMRSISLGAACMIFLLSLGIFAEDSAARMTQRCVSSRGGGLTSDFGPRRQQNKGIRILRMNPGVTGLTITNRGGGVLFSQSVAVGRVITLTGVRWIGLKATGSRSYGCAILIGIFN